LREDGCAAVFVALYQWDIQFLLSEGSEKDYIDIWNLQTLSYVYP